MLTEQQQEEVKQEYISIIKSLTRKDCDIDGFINYLENSDFFSAPASSKYHCSFPGGLCLHSINVYKILLDLTNRLARKVIVDKDNKETKVPFYNKDSIILVGLLHDLNKIGLFGIETKNKKVYCEDGDKKDEHGKYRWVAIDEYSTKAPEDKTSLGPKGVTSYLRASAYFPLTEEEMHAILFQYSAVDREPMPDLTQILSRYNLSVFLHSADIIATYCIEK